MQSCWELFLSVTLAVTVLKCSSQRAYILKLLWDQGISQIHLDTVFHALIMFKFQYALCAWSGFLTQTEKGMISGFLRRMYANHFVSECFEIYVIMDDIDKKFFKRCFPQPTVCILKQSTWTSCKGS